MKITNTHLVLFAFAAGALVYLARARGLRINRAPDTTEEASQFSAAARGADEYLNEPAQDLTPWWETDGVAT